MARKINSIKIRKVRKIRKRKLTVKKPRKPGTSKIEGSFGKFLRLELGLKIERQFPLAYKFYDFKIKDTNMLIEFDGSYFHCDPRIYIEGAINEKQKECISNDKYKDALALSCGYKLLRIWEKDFRSNKHLVRKQILDFIK